MGKKTFVVTEEERQLRLDVYLAVNSAVHSRSRIKKAIAEGWVLVNDNVAKAGYRLKPGDTVQLCLPETKPYELLAEEIPLSLVYEDSALLLLDKAAGMVVHPAFGHASGTIVNAILAHCHDLAGVGGVLRPGIVHRLDKDTSGLLVVAKTDAAHQSLADQFKQRSVRKEYLALVYGDMKGDEGLIDLPVGRDKMQRKKMSTRSSRAKEARTRWRVQERYRAATLVLVRMETGRTHQIRVHMSNLGHPLVGDHLYGGTKRGRNINDHRLRDVLAAMKRQALHASGLSFHHPLTRERMSFSSPLPPDMAELCAFLKAYTQVTPPDEDQGK